MKYILLATLFIASCGSSGKIYVQSELLQNYYIELENEWEVWASCPPDKELIVTIRGEMFGLEEVPAKAIFENKEKYRIVHPSLPSGKMDIIKINLISFK